ncbi:PQQ-dependent sugar dehydrogenase [Halorientalis salina]|uniref:PQQ-dependent sugar dehydrogenase n=1 Tax=Halorientalis salina TaxID=2932266 RepID=UPI0010AD499D|nr:PQQ-dependent sugar dehydrogenase [Halorientalis salina]
MVEHPLTRRHLLAAVGASGFAGCTGFLGGAPTNRTPGSSSTPGDGTTPSDRPEQLPYDTSVTHDETAWDGYAPDWSAPTDTPATDDLGAEVLVENLEIPWDLSVAPTGELFVTERTGRIVRFEAFADGRGETVAEPGAVIDAEAVDPGAEEGSWWVEGGEGGLLGIAVHPTYPDPPLVYAYFTTETDSGTQNAVRAFDVRDDDPASTSWPIVEGIPADTIHNGGRIEFGPANYLWITTGDASEGERAQDPTDLGGKILRVTPGGDPAPDNPDLGSDADPRIFTLGHRNPQGISWLPDATPVVTEHGPGGGDEVNVLRAGANYGWPEARNGEGYADYADTDYQPPVADAVSWAPAGSVFYTGDAVHGLRNRLLFGGLIGQLLVAVTLGTDANPPAVGDGELYDGDRYDDRYLAATQERLEDELGRIRHVEQGPDGDLYAITSNRDGRASGPFPGGRDDVLVRLTAE